MQNLDILCSLSHEEYKTLSYLCILMYLSAMSVCTRVFKNGNYLSILRYLVAFSVVSLCNCEEPVYHHYNYHFMLS